MPLDRNHYHKRSQGQKPQPHNEMLKLVHVCVINFIMFYVSLLIYSVCIMLLSCTYAFYFMIPVSRGRTDQKTKGQWSTLHRKLKIELHDLH